ncbi:unnamed protein product [Arabidopsis arenosa]|uniref:Uncharacterized protein n=1 Tax=Arabidopsis arenosa TaxID=38785 RepID=A0A8S2A173_ARAAE|nr:unnamed protein product [Arabidopsis arenosa]
MSSGNDYSRFLSAQNVAAPARSQARSSRNRNPSSPASQNQLAVGSTPPPSNPNTPNPSNPNSPNPSHSATQPALNSLTLDELLDINTVLVRLLSKPCERTGDTTPDFLVLLDETHRKPDGTFINRKSEELYKEVAPRKKKRIYGVGSLHNEASSVHVGPLPTHNDREVLLEKLAAAEARLQLQAEKINSFDAYWEYLAEKDPVFAGMYRGPSEPANADTTRTAEGDQTGTNQTGTNQTGTDQTATGTRPGSSTSQAI